jgi:hypothetical protein
MGTFSIPQAGERRRCWLNSGTDLWQNPRSVKEGRCAFSLKPPQSEICETMCNPHE